MAYIQVKNLQTGQTGKLPEEKFDPSKYQHLGALGPEHQPATETQTPAPAEEPRVAGGIIPTITSLIGGLVGSPGGTAMSSAGAAGATIPGYAIESGLAGMINSTNLGGGTKYKENIPAADIAKDTAIQGGSNFVGGKIGEFLGKIFPGVAKELVKIGLPETGNAAADAAKTDILGTGKSFAKQVVERGKTGTADMLVRDADTNKKLLSTAIDKGIDVINNTSSHIDSALGDAGGENSAQKFLRTVWQDTKDYIGSHANISVDGKTAAHTAVDKEMQAAIDKAGTTGWQSVADLKNVGNNLSKAGQLSEAEAAKDAGFTALRSTIQKKLNAELPDFGKLWTEYGFYNDLDRLASKRAGQTITKSDIIRALEFGGGAGVISRNPATAITAGLISAAAPKLATSPLLTTNLAQFLMQAPKLAAPSAQLTGDVGRRIAFPN